MARGLNAQLAVDQFLLLSEQHGWTKQTCWKGIVFLLLSCDVWRDGFVRLGTLKKHAGVPDSVVYREANDLILTAKGQPSAALRRSLALTDYLSQVLDIPRENVCDSIGRFFRSPGISDLQPNNTRGHAFRSLICVCLEQFGNPSVQFEEEIDAHNEFPGWALPTRSADAKLDIIARKNGVPVALISVRWALRHDRIDVVEEAITYGPAARRSNKDCALYGVVGEFDPNRLLKVLEHCPPSAKNPVLDACVHYCPDLLKNGLGVNGKTEYLKSLEWLIDQSFTW